MNLKQIIIFYPSFERGGVEKTIFNLLNYFKDKNIKIKLISAKNTRINILKKINNCSLIHPKEKINIFSNRLNTAFNCGLLLFKLLKMSNSNQTIIHSMQSNIIPIIICKIMGFKIIIRNSENPISSLRYDSNKFSFVLIYILRFIFYNCADKIITNSKGSAKSLKLFLLRNNFNKVKYIYNPFIRKVFKINKHKKKIIMSAGRLTKQKNFSNLIRAFIKSELYLDGYKLFIYGEGEDKRNLKLLIKDEKMSKVIFLKGYKKKLNREYSKAKIFVLPSIYEGLGNVLIEAINYGTPCIATNCQSGPNEILSFGKGGYIVPIFDVNSLSETLKLSVKNYRLSLKKLKYARSKLSRFFAKSQSNKYFYELKKTLR